MFNECTKHIEIDCHFVRDALQDGFISPRYLRSDLQLADIFNKALHSLQFQTLTHKFGILDLHAPT